MQICAKLGGEPWGIDNLPFTKVPTMIIGLDVYNKNGRSIVGCCASFNNRFTRYLSCVKDEEQGKPLDGIIRDCILEVVQMVNIFIV